MYLCFEPWIFEYKPLTRQQSRQLQSLNISLTKNLSTIKPSHFSILMSSLTPSPAFESRHPQDYDLLEETIEELLDENRLFKEKVEKLEADIETFKRIQKDLTRTVQELSKPLIDQMRCLEDALKSFDHVSTLKRVRSERLQKLLDEKRFTPKKPEPSSSQ